MPIDESLHVLIFSLYLAVHMLTDKCFKKCITSKITSGALDRSEEPCMRNCVDRFMDASGAVIRHLEQMRQ